MLECDTDHNIWMVNNAGIVLAADRACPTPTNTNILHSIAVGRAWPTPTIPISDTLSLWVGHAWPGG